MNNNGIELFKQYENAKGILVCNSFFIDGKVLKTSKLYEKTVDELVLELKSLKNKLFYEEVFYSSKTKTLRLYFDIEWYTDEEDLEKDYLNYLLKALDTLEITYSIASASSYRDAKEKFKNSYRVISTNMVFNNMLEMKAYIKHGLSNVVMDEYSRTHDVEQCVSFYQQMFNKSTDKILDDAVYCNGQRKVRLPSTYKMTKDGKYDPQTYMKIIKGETRDFFISAPVIEAKRIDKWLIDAYVNVGKTLNETTGYPVVKKYTDAQAESIIKKMNDIIEILPADTAFRTQSWSNVISAIAGIASRSGRDLLSVALKFSVKAKNYDEMAVKSKYRYFVSDKFKGKRRGIGTLIELAKATGLWAERIQRDDIRDYKSNETDIIMYLNSINGSKLTADIFYLNIGKLFYAVACNDLCLVKLKGRFVYKPLQPMLATMKKYTIFNPLKCLKPISEMSKKEIKEASSNCCDKLIDRFELFSLSDCVFDPSKEYGLYDNNVFNCYEGFQAKKVIVDDECMKQIEPILHHLKEVWCSGVESDYKYLINWFVKMMKRPEKKTEIAVILTGGQGTGKNILTNFLLDKVFGRSISCEINDIDRLIARFNSMLENKIFTVLDEASNSSGDDYNKTADLLKNKITSDVQTIEIKGKESREVADYNNFIICSNSKTPVKVENDCRRYFWLGVSDKYKGNSTYFKELASSLNERSGDCFYSWILTHEIEYMDLPMTSTKKAIKIETLRPFQQFLRSEAKFSNEAIICTGIYEQYCRFLVRNGLKPESSFSLWKNIPTKYFIRTTTNNKRHITINEASCKAYFNEVLNIIDWKL